MHWKVIPVRDAWACFIKTASCTHTVSVRASACATRHRDFMLLIFTGVSFT